MSPVSYGDSKDATSTLEEHLAVSFKTKHAFIILSNIHIFFGIYPKELRTYVHTTAYTQIFIAALFIISKTWKHPDVFQ